MTILHSAGGRNCSKTFRPDPKTGGLGVESYSKEIRWKHSLAQIDGLPRLYEVIEELSSMHDCIVIHGSLPEEMPYDPEVGVFRRMLGSDKGMFIPMARQWLAFDIDAVRVPDDVPADDAAMIGWLVGQMAAPIRGTSCVYQWTSSYMLSGDPRALRVRLWFWCSGPVFVEQIQTWVDTINTVAVDSSIYRTVQPIYVNGPIFTDGAEDPVLCRVGVFHGERDVVQAHEFPDARTAIIAGHAFTIKQDQTEDEEANREQIDNVKARILSQRTSGSRHHHMLAVACELVGVGASDADIALTSDELLRVQGREPQPNEIQNAIKTARAKAKAGTLKTSTLPVSKLFPKNEEGYVDEAVDAVEDTGPVETPEDDFGKHGWLNAVRYAAKYYPNGGYVRWQENDYEWNGTHYAPMEAEELRANMQRNTALTPAMVDAAMRALRSKFHSAHKAAPAWLASPRRHVSNLVAFQNGVLDIDKWLLDPATPLMPHNPQLFTLAALPMNYDPKAQCPTFDAWVPQMFAGDPEQQREFAKMLGYVFIDGNPFHKMFVLLGRPRAGKGMTQRLIQKLVGDNNYAATDLSLLGSQFGLANLIGRRVAIVGEMNEQKSNSISTASIDAIKRITGGDSLGIDRKNHSIVEMALPVRFVCACNRMPAFLDPSGALADRIVMFTFNTSHSGKEDYGLEHRLCNELSGIVNRALVGLRELMVTDGRFVQPASVRAELEQHRDSMSPIRIFAKECLTHDANADVLVDDVYTAYRQWTIREGRNPLNKSNMMKELYDMFPKSRRMRERAEGVRQSKLGGLRLTDAGADALTGSAFD